MTRPLLVLFLLLGVSQARAQDTTLTATVIQIAGDNAYINAGRDAGIQPNDTLRVAMGGRVLGSMIVQSTSSRQSVLAFTGAPFPLTRGVRIEVTFTRRSIPSEAPPVDASLPPVAEAPPATPVMRRPQPATRQQRTSLRVDGRATVGLNLLSSETRSIGVESSPVSRQFATPSLTLNLTVRNLPSQTRLHVNVRAEHRRSSLATLLPERSMRTYQLSLQKELSFGAMQFGRFYNSQTPHGGYWDGASFLLGSRNAGVGMAAGFMPEQANQGFTTEFPRLSAFAHVQTRAGRPVRYRAAVSYHEVHPTSLYLDHRFGEFSQEVTWGGFSMDQDLVLDQDPLGGGVVISEFQLDPRIRVTERIQVRGRYSLRRPYRMYSTVAPFSSRRDQVGGGFTFRSGDAAFGGEYSTRYVEGGYDSRTVSIYGATPAIQPLALSLSANASRWTSDFGEALYASAGLTRGMVGGQVRLEYGFYRTTTVNQAEAIDAHRVGISAALPVGRRMFWNGRVTYQQSDYLNSVSGQTSLQYRF